MQLTIEVRRLLLECSPGARATSFTYGIARRTATTLLLDVLPEAPGGEPSRLHIEPLRTSSGTRALRIADADHPDASPLRANGQPDLWLAVPPRPAGRR